MKIRTLFAAARALFFFILWLIFWRLQLTLSFSPPHLMIWMPQVELASKELQTSTATSWLSESDIRDRRVNNVNIKKVLISLKSYSRSLNWTIHVVPYLFCTQCFSPYICSVAKYVELPCERKRQQHDSEGLLRSSKHDDYCLGSFHSRKAQPRGGEVCELAIKIDNYQKSINEGMMWPHRSRLFNIFRLIKC